MEEENKEVQDVKEEVVQDTSKGPEKPKKKGKGLKIFIIILVLAALCVGGYFAVTKFLLKPEEIKDEKKASGEDRTMEVTDNTPAKFVIEEGKLSDFDLSFLKEENKDNMIYSPLSIKYCFKMLEDAAEGETKNQIEKIVGDFKMPSYKTSKNLSLANAMFISEDFKDKVKEEYSKTLKEDYDAEVKYDPFTSPDSINKWISDKTFGILKNVLDDVNKEDRFYLVNALAIDMEWKNKFLEHLANYISYDHEKFGWGVSMDIEKLKFDNGKDVSSMEVAASINKYDIVNELGEDTIRKTVRDEFIKHFSSSEADQYEIEEMLDGDKSQANIEKKADEYVENYIKEINKNYKRVDKSTDFRYYVDDNVKVFAKELKEYDGTTLEYIGIMPKEGDLDKYVENVNAKEINNLIENLKDISLEDSKDGVVTKITGSIPKFTIAYELDLMNDLKALGVKDVFEQGKADLSNLTDEKDTFIGKVIHKANIEFTQDGIKAAAVTMAGGLGAGEMFDYYFDVPVEEVDITFDKPFMYIIRDKDNGEVWFVGTVNDPLEYMNDDSVEYKH